MKIMLDNLTVNYIPDDFDNLSGKIPILFLHGFTGSSGDWEFLFDKLEKKYAPLAIDLPGHGESSSQEIIDNIREGSIVDLLSGFLSELDISWLVICGYSMGGRAALSFTIKYPGKVSGLILESSTAGIISQEERISRIKNDEKLAERILEIGVKSFIDEWYDNPLYNSIKEKSKLYEKLISGKKIYSPIGLSNSLRDFSSGRMPSCWNDLKNLRVPVLLVTGENDEKFSRINSNMLKFLPNAEHVNVPSSGHITHLENEGYFINLLNTFLSRI